MIQGKKLGLIVTGVAVVAAIGVGAAVGLSGGDDSGEQEEAKPKAKQSADIPGFCTGDAKNWNASTGMCVITHVAGCQNQNQMMDINNKLAKENPIGSSGYHSDTPVIPLLQQLTTLTDRALDQPHVPAPIKTALQKQAEDLKKEIDLYKQEGDWAKVDLDRGLKNSPSMACIDFVADLADRKSAG
ncbi:hypothetical protein QOM21_35085 [Streptomyces sp. Pv4-95]|uniref:hypothetical protein n=1 Tax=Streptomyces sp. Pv4-95 TaxID=3049543 RepID=UPI00389177F7